jgi:hypothetical protein
VAVVKIGFARPVKLHVQVQTAADTKSNGAAVHSKNGKYCTETKEKNDAAVAVGTPNSTEAPCLRAASAAVVNLASSCPGRSHTKKVVTNCTRKACNYHAAIVAGRHVITVHAAMLLSDVHKKVKLRMRSRNNEISNSHAKKRALFLVNKRINK